VSILRRLISRTFRFFSRRSISEFIEVHSSADIGACSLEVRKPIRHKKYLKIGQGSIVQSRFVFEKETGEVTIGDNTFVGGGLFVCIDRITVGNDVLISWGCTFIDNDAHALQWELRRNDVKEWKRGLAEGKLGHYKNWEAIKSAEIKIEDKVWIGFNCIILKGISIGEGAVVGAGSVVASNIPAYTVVAGNPARVIRNL
jgi:acetyltransferase-like isoleucine patch superfamily enzyme